MPVQPPSPTYVGPLPRRGAGNNKPISLIVIHCTAGAEPGVSGAARGTVAFTKRSGVVSSYHYVADSRESLQAVWDSTVAFHCGGANSHSIGYELSCSLSNEGAGHWDNPDHVAMLKIAAKDVARLCLAYDIPIRHLTVAQVRAREKGICGHVDVRSAFPGSTSHWDPGPHFPWSQFLDMVRAVAAELTEPVTPPPPPKPKPKKLGIHLCYAGDWNEGPRSNGTHSPQWIAEQGGMAIGLPPANAKGQHGIDYPMSSATLTDVRRLPENRSDHNPVAFKVTHPEDDRTLVGCTFNVERDRSAAERQELVTWLAETGAREGIDFFALQEVRQYHEVLKTVPGYHLFASTDPKGVEHNALLIRDGVLVADDNYRLTSSVGWITVKGGNHAPSSAVLATLNGWLRVASIHEAPTVDWVSGEPVGPARRVAVRVSSARTLARIGRYWKARR